MKPKTIRKIADVLLMLLLIAFAALMTVPAFAHAETVVDPVLTVTEPVEPFTWEYLGSVLGCSAFVILFVQATKKMIDKVLHIPTALYAYVIAILTLLAATHFTVGLTWSDGLLTAFNGWVVACTASRSYDMISGK